MSKDKLNNYELIIYEHYDPYTYRYALGFCKKNIPAPKVKYLVCIGLNSSTGTDKKLDRTLHKVKKIALQNNYNGWIMFNLCPLRETNPEELPSNECFQKDDELKMHCQRNNEAIRTVLIENLNYINDIWAAWGDLIDKRIYLKENLIDIYRNIKDIEKENNKEFSWHYFYNSDDSFLTKKGHPRHPRVLKKDAKIKKFKINEYIKKIEKEIE